MDEQSSGYWSSRTLFKRLPSLIVPFDKNRIKCCSYELSMGNEAFVTGDKGRTVLGPDGAVVIPPGQLCVLLSLESVVIPDDAIAFISMKSKHKFRGLINISGFHVDPGFRGKLVFTAYNAGVQEIHLSVGSPVFVIWFAYLDDKTDDAYHGDHQGQQRIPDEVITNLAAKLPSPGSLMEEIKDLRHKVAVYSTVAATIIALFAGTLISTTLKSCSTEVPQRPTSQPTQAATIPNPQDSDLPSRGQTQPASAIPLPK